MVVLSADSERFQCFGGKWLGDTHIEHEINQWIINSKRPLTKIAV